MSQPRSLGSYLLVPRTEGLGKALWILPTSYAAGRYLGEVEGVSIGTATVVWAVFEMGLYGARYMLNDLLDAEVDRAHVAADRRGRLPDHPLARSATGMAVVARLAVALVAVLLLPLEERTILLVAAVALAAITTAYEAARQAIRRRPLDDWHQATFSSRELAVFGLVGTGYALRAGVGAALAGGDGQIVASGVVLGGALGLLMVMMAWTLDAVMLRATSADAVLARKSHVAVLARLTVPDPERPDVDHQPLLVGGPARMTGWLFAATGLAAVGFVASLGSWPGPGRTALLLVVVTALAPLLLAAWPSWWAGPVVVALNAGAAWALTSRGGRVDMVVVLLYVSAMVAWWRAVSLTPVLVRLEAGAEPAARPDGQAGRPSRSAERHGATDGLAASEGGIR